MSWSRTQHSDSGESKTSNPSSLTIYQLSHCVPISVIFKSLNTFNFLPTIVLSSDNLWKQFGPRSGLTNCFISSNKWFKRDKHDVCGNCIVEWV